MPTVPATNLLTSCDLRNVGPVRVLVVCATGPSIGEIPGLKALGLHSRIDVLAINRPVPDLDPSAFYLFQDATSYVRNRDYLATYSGLMLAGFRALPGDTPNTVFFPLRQGMGFSRDLTGGWFVGKSSSYAALQVALWMRYPRIYFLGVDMGAVGGALWHYGQNPDITAGEPTPRFELEFRFFDHAAAVLSPEERKRVTFASAHNLYAFPDAFNRRDHRAIVPEILEAAEAV